jgi:hypothetical protein
MFKAVALKYLPVALLIVLIAAILDMSRYAKNPPRHFEIFAWPEGVTAWALLLTLVVIAWQSVETRAAAKAGEVAAVSKWST